MGRVYPPWDFQFFVGVGFIRPEIPGLMNQAPTFEIAALSAVVRNDIIACFSPPSVIAAPLYVIPAKAGIHSSFCHCEERSDAAIPYCILYLFFVFSLTGKPANRQTG